MRTLTRAAVQRIMAMVAAFALAMIGLVSVVAAPAHAATDAAATLTVTEASEAAGLSVKVDGENFTDLPPAVGGPTSGGLYAAIVDRDLVIDDTPQGADVTLGAAYVANIQNGVFTTTVTAAADKLDKAKNYDVVTWSAHGNIASASLVTRDEITLTAAQKEALFPAPKTVDVSKPTISGTVKVGNTVTAKASSATSGAKVSYQWFKPTTDGKHWAKITNGGNKSTYTIPAALNGKKILVKATATKAGYTSTWKNSSAKTVAAGTLSLAKPTISGTAKAGKKLTAKVSSKTAGASVSFQWFKPATDGKHWAKITNGGNKSTYTVPSALKGKKILVKATATKTGYASTSKNSSAKTIAK